VVASGPNTMYLHYTANNQILERNSLVLMDAGCEFGGYAADITRTFPVSGKFTDVEKDLYTVVLASLKSCVKMCSEEARVNLYDLHDQSKKVLLEEFKQIGLDFSQNDNLFNQIYPHFVGHPLGLDLHDCPTFQRSTRLEDGNVITIEPGVL
jgi:intermediate cleaving peptidase 55